MSLRQIWRESRKAKSKGFTGRVNVYPPMATEGISPLVEAFYNETRGRAFSSDDFRELGYDRCMGRPDKQIGSFFGGLKRLGLVLEVGWVRSRIESNHIRRIRVYEWTTKAAEAMG